MKSVAMVTGGRRGLGRSCALALAGRGFDIILVDIVEDDESRETVKRLEMAGARVSFFRADISELSYHSALAEEAWGAFGKIDCLVNNAGVAPVRASDVLNLAPSDFEYSIGVNLRGTMFLTQAVAKLMSEEVGSNYRSIIFITSIAANHVSVEIPEYCISKAALSMVSGLFAVTMADFGVQVHEVRPGFIKTAMTLEAEGAPTEAIEAHIAQGRVPMARWGEGEDVGRCVAALAVGEVPYATGHPIYVDGGYGIPTA